LYRLRAESLFGTMKTRVGYPKKPFETLEEAQAWVDRFVHWYNEEHRHSALNWVTPMARHTGEERELLRRREQTYRRARRRNPQRWSRQLRVDDLGPGYPGAGPGPGCFPSGIERRFGCLRLAGCRNDVFKG
jgi:hypothetical protein